MIAAYKPYLGQNNSGKVFDPKTTKPLGKPRTDKKPLVLSMRAQPDGAMVIAFTRAK